MGANRLSAGIVASATAALLLASHVDGRWHKKLATDTLVALPGDTPLSFSYSYSFDMEDDGEPPFVSWSQPHDARPPSTNVEPTVPPFLEIAMFFLGTKNVVRFQTDCVGLFAVVRDAYPSF